MLRCQLSVELGIGAEVVTLIDFEGDLPCLGGVERGLLDGNDVKHVTLVASLAEEHLVLCVVARRVRILQLAELHPDRVRAVFQVIVRVLPLSQYT